MITLKSENAFAHGNHREVYRHPENPNRCLKLMTEHWKESPRYKRANLLGKIFRPHSYFNENECEYQFSRKVAKRVGEPAWSFIARAYGYRESDRGQVLEVELITDADGQISLTLKEYLFRNGMTTSCEAALKIFWEQLDGHWVFTQARPDNLATRISEDGSCQIFAIDGYAFNTFIPLAKWFRSIQKPRLEKLHREQQKSIKKILLSRESGQVDDLGNQGMQSL